MKRSSVRIRIPDTMIKGYGFKTPRLFFREKGILTFKEMRNDAETEK